MNRSQIAIAIYTVKTQRMKKNPSEAPLQTVKLHFFYYFQPQIKQLIDWSEVHLRPLRDSSFLKFFHFRGKEALPDRQGVIKWNMEIEVMQVPMSLKQFGQLW